MHFPYLTWQTVSYLYNTLNLISITIVRDLETFSKTTSDVLQFSLDIDSSKYWFQEKRYFWLSLVLAVGTA